MNTPKNLHNLHSLQKLQPLNKNMSKDNISEIKKIHDTYIDELVGEMIVKRKHKFDMFPYRHIACCFLPTLRIHRHKIKFWRKFTKRSIRRLHVLSTCRDGSNYEITKITQKEEKKINKYYCDKNRLKRKLEKFKTMH